MYVAMPSEVLEQLDLTQRALRQDLFAENIRDLLDCNAFVCLLVRRRAVEHMLASICTSCRVDKCCDVRTIQYHKLPGRVPSSRRISHRQ